MNKYIFLDEAGTADLKTYKFSPYFTVCGVVVGENQRDKIKQDFEELKHKYFKSKNYIIHTVTLRGELRYRNIKQEDFAKDLDIFLKKQNFFLLFTCVDKEKAIKYSWVNKTVYVRSYKSIVGNLIKFLVAKNMKGHIWSEASKIEQDISIYKSLFHYVANGIHLLGISPADVKKHLCSLCFVTKANNDSEEQLADLFGSCGVIEMKILKKQIQLEDLDPIAKVLYKHMKQKIFGKNNASTPYKKKLYKDISPFIIYPK